MKIKMSFEAILDQGVEKKAKSKKSYKLSLNELNTALETDSLLLEQSSRGIPFVDDIIRAFVRGRRAAKLADFGGFTGPVRALKGSDFIDVGFGGDRDALIDAVMDSTDPKFADAQRSIRQALEMAQENRTATVLDLDLKLDDDNVYFLIGMTDEGPAIIGVSLAKSPNDLYRAGKKLTLKRFLDSPDLIVTRTDAQRISRGPALTVKQYDILSKRFEDLYREGVLSSDDMQTLTRRLDTRLNIPEMVNPDMLNSVDEIDDALRGANNLVKAGVYEADELSDYRNSLLSRKNALGDDAVDTAGTLGDTLRRLGGKIVAAPAAIINMLKGAFLKFGKILPPRLTEDDVIVIAGKSVEAAEAIGLEMLGGQLGKKADWTTMAQANYAQARGLEDAVIPATVDGKFILIDPGDTGEPVRIAVWKDGLVVFEQFAGKTRFLGRLDTAIKTFSLPTADIWAPVRFAKSLFDNGVDVYWDKSKDLGRTTKIIKMLGKLILDASTRSATGVTIQRTGRIPLQYAYGFVPQKLFGKGSDAVNWADAMITGEGSLIGRVFSFDTIGGAAIVLGVIRGLADQYTKFEKWMGINAAYKSSEVVKLRNRIFKILTPGYLERFASETSKKERIALINDEISKGREVVRANLGDKDADSIKDISNLHPNTLERARDKIATKLDEVADMQRTLSKKIADTLQMLLIADKTIVEALIEWDAETENKKIVIPSSASVPELKPDAEVVKALDFDESDQDAAAAMSDRGD